MAPIVPAVAICPPAHGSVGNLTTRRRARMTTRWTLTFDCHDAATMARFWTVALGYVDSPPPEGWDTWEDWLRHFDVPEEEWGDGASLEDPQGVLPSVSFLKVPEPKTAKNRLHLDLQVSG